MNLHEVYKSISEEVRKNEEGLRNAGDDSAPCIPLPRGWERHLTVREIQIVQMVAEGMSNKEIATRLVLSPFTIKSHLAKIGDVIGSGRREVIVVECMRAGVVT